MIAVTRRTVPSTLTGAAFYPMPVRSPNARGPVALNIGIRQAPIDRSDHIHYS